MGIFQSIATALGTLFIIFIFLVIVDFCLSYLLKLILVISFTLHSYKACNKDTFYYNYSGIGYVFIVYHILLVAFKYSSNMRLVSYNIAVNGWRPIVIGNVDGGSVEIKHNDLWDKERPVVLLHKYNLYRGRFTEIGYFVGKKYFLGLFGSGLDKTYLFTESVTGVTYYGSQ